MSVTILYGESAATVAGAQVGGEHAGQPWLGGAADEVELFREVSVADPDGDRTKGLGDQDARHLTNGELRAKRYGRAEEDLSVGAFGVEEGDVDHVADRGERPKRGDEDRHRHGNAKRR